MTLEEVEAEMGALYGQVKQGDVEVKLGHELANIAGKYLKARSLRHAERVFEHYLSQRTVKPTLDLPAPMSMGEFNESSTNV